MSEPRPRISKQVLQLLQQIDLETLGPKLEALGVRSASDLELLSDSDLVRWGLTTIERRRFFTHVRSLLGDSVAALSSPDHAQNELPRLAERLLATTGPLTIRELGARLLQVAPLLTQDYSSTDWLLLVEAGIRSCARLQLEDGGLVSIKNAALFSASREVVADTACWVCVCGALSSPRELAVLAPLCRASREVVDGPAVWFKLLQRWYPKATLLNPDWEAQAALERNLETALEDNYSLAAVTMGLQPDTPHDLAALMEALPQRTTPKAMLKFMSKHPDHFRQSPDGSKFCVARLPGNFEECQDWRMVNPFKLPLAAGSCVLEPEAQQQEQQRQQQLCKELDAKQAFRMYHTGLLLQRTDQSKRGRLEAWEYYTESNSKCVLAPGDLLDLADCRVRAIRRSDPAVVHELVSQTLEGIVSKVKFGFWHRRVQILTMALNGAQLRVGREQRKKFERKLLEFMEWVGRERGFGFYRCEACGSRWKSGFSYEEMTQECLQCGTFSKPYRIKDLESYAAARAQSKASLLTREAARERLRGAADRRDGAGGGEASLVTREAARERKRRGADRRDSLGGSGGEPPSSCADRHLRVDVAAAARFVQHHTEKPVSDPHPRMQVDTAGATRGVLHQVEQPRADAPGSKLAAASSRTVSRASSSQGAADASAQQLGDNCAPEQVGGSSEIALALGLSVAEAQSMGLL